ARLAQYRSYRDADSRDYMKGIGVDESASPVMPDVAFLFPAEARERPARGPLTIGLGVMNYRGWGANSGGAIYNEYIDRHARFVEWAEGRRGYRVRLLIGQDTDMRSVRDLEQRLGRTLVIGQELASFHDVEREIEGTDIVVAARYHVLVAALNTGRP